MIKVMIADDEKVAIDSLKFIIEKNFTDVEIISTARSGREAIEKVEENVPDVLFMDIRMPGINGIEAIREIRSRHKQVVIIVLTAFDQFEFAKEAVNLGVMEYLLKPVNRAKVVEVVNKAINIIRIEKEKWKVELEMKEKLEYMTPILENGFIYSILLFDDNSKELLNYKRLFDIKEDGGTIFTVEIVDEESGGYLDTKIGYSVKSQQFYPYFTDMVKSMCNCIVGPVMLNRVVVFVPTDAEKDEFAGRLEAVSLAETLLQRLTGKLNCGLKIGIGKGYKRFDMLSASYEESLKALRYLQGTGVMHFMDISARNAKGPEYPEYKEKYLLQKVSAGDAAESINAYHCIFDWLAGEYGTQPMKIKNKLLEILFLINHLSWEYEPDEELLRIDFLEEMLPINDLGELRLWCRKRIENIITQINSYRDYKVGRLTKRAKEYIKTNYSKSITLEDVAREINVSPQYLSKLFKEETGENFIDYLTAIRIRIAKNLLESDELSVKEICYSVGYSDPNYFSRIFKRIVGATPTEYKESFLSAQ
ncbi:response regulator [Sinanaerobacter chloroacetimidivorans]|uniref:Stage 0 sporulation protein A homolog n=1 Tax=Sinanaerobacter chloroacetimidivorans TaxID=2818044 RepID=A0A8J7W2S4_9FIRM|nr:response regulator [Sinanaerobacter chloroacetimidivorans]MBR0598215.1 response regulator [Sinanaerobacter chloroacetimidivorans]